MNTRIFRAVLRLLATVLVASFVSSAFAQTTGLPGAADLNNINPDQFWDMMKAAKDTSNSYATIFIGEGIDLAKAFFMITLAWWLMILAISKNEPQHALGGMAIHAFRTALVFTMLSSWTSDVAPTSALGGSVTAPGSHTSVNMGDYRLPITVKNLLVDSFDELQGVVFQKAPGRAMDKGDVIKAVGSVAYLFIDANHKRGEIRDAARAQAAGKSIWDWLSTSVSMNLDAMGDALMSVIVYLVVGFLAMILMVVYLFIIFYGDILVGLAMFLGPLMVPCLLFPKLESLFDKWLHFIIQGGFYKLIAAFVAVLTLGTINTIQVQVTAMYATATLGADSIANQTLFSGGFLLSIVMTIVYMWFGIEIMKMVPQLTHSLMNGYLGAAASFMPKAGSAAGASSQTTIGNAASGNISGIGSQGMGQVRGFTGTGP